MSNPKVSKIMIWRSRKINIGNYNTVELSAGVEITFETPVAADSKEVQEGLDAARQIVKDEFTKQFAPYKKVLEDAKKAKENKPK